MQLPCRFYCGVVLPLSVLLLFGCAPEEKISVYDVPKHADIQLDVGTPQAEAVAEADPGDAGKPGDKEAAGKVPTRLLASIVLNDNVAWFFKCMAPADKFGDDTAEKFDGLMTKVAFPNPKKPTWELPEGWKEQPGSGIAAAHLFLGDLKFTVTRLGVPSGNERQYLLDNVNRWRGQVALSALSSSQMAQESHKISTADERDALIVDFTGQAGGGGRSMGGPFANAPFAKGPFSGGAKPAAGPPKPSASAAKPAPPKIGPPKADSAPFTYDLPSGWQDLGPGMMQLAKFLVEDDDANATIAVSRLGGAAGGLLPNVNRWRGQIGLDPYPNEAAIEAEEVQLSGRAAKLFRFAGSKGRDMTVVMAPRGTSTWFVKMLGDADVVKAQDATFVEFMKSIRIK